MKENNLCYVCLDETNNKSPCECKYEICENCLNYILLKNIKKCSICRTNFYFKKNLEKELYKNTYVYLDTKSMSKNSFYFIIKIFLIINLSICFYIYLNYDKKIKHK